MPDRRLVGLGHAVDIGGNLDADRPAVTRLVAGNLDSKSLIRHRPNLCLLGSVPVDLERRPYRRLSLPGTLCCVPSIGAGICEIRVREHAGTFRAIYVATFADVVYVLHAFQKKTLGCDNDSDV